MATNNTYQQPCMEGEESKEFMITENCFDSIMYHLPDDKNLMKLKVNDKYLQFLEKSITFQAKYLKKQAKHNGYRRRF